MFMSESTSSETPASTSRRSFSPALFQVQPFRIRRPRTTISSPTRPTPRPGQPGPQGRAERAEQAGQRLRDVHGGGQGEDGEQRGHPLHVPGSGRASQVAGPVGRDVTSGGFAQVLPAAPAGLPFREPRWVVERGLAWLTAHRRSAGPLSRPWFAASTAAGPPPAKAAEHSACPDDNQERSSGGGDKGNGTIGVTSSTAGSRGHRRFSRRPAIRSDTRRRWGPYSTNRQFRHSRPPAGRRRPSGRTVR